MMFQSLNSAMRLSLQQRTSEDLVYQAVTIGSILALIGTLWIF